MMAAGINDEARFHLKKYHDAIQTLYDYISQTWPANDIKDRAKRDEALTELQKDITDVRELVVIYKEDLVRQQKELIVMEAKLAAGEPLKEGEKLTPEERLAKGEEMKRKSATLTRQKLAIESFIRTFVLTDLSPEEMDLRERCVAYFREFNSGHLIPAIEFLDPPAERRDALRQRLMGQMEKKIRFLRPKFKAFEISRAKGQVTFECEMVTPTGRHPNTRLRIGWRRVSGLWMISELP